MRRLILVPLLLLAGCRFPDRASLEAALLRLDPRRDERLRPVRLS